MDVNKYHIHDLRHPYRQYIMCTADDCTELIKENGEILSANEALELIEEIVKDYNG